MGCRITVMLGGRYWNDTFLEDVVIKDSWDEVDFKKENGWNE